ncbi:MAG: type II toxin-antitoxin system VapC family toxin, partial [Acidimicrobiia bacterium]
MIVVDASAIIEVLTAKPPNHLLVARLQGADSLHAPHLLDVEALNALRRLVSARQVTEDRAEAARHDLAELVITRYPHQGLVDRIW